MAATVLSFIFVTILGGLFGAVLQQRSWRHKWAMEKTERRTNAAMQTFEDVSGLLDQRLYCLHQLRVWTERDDAEMYDAALNKYRDAIRDWNFSINKLLAKLQIYIDIESRDTLNFDVGAKFVRAGELVEEAIRERRKTDKQIDLPHVKETIDALRQEVYLFNIKLLGKIEEKHRRQRELPILGELKQLIMVKDDDEINANASPPQSRSVVRQTDQT